MVDRWREEESEFAHGSNFAFRSGLPADRLDATMALRLSRSTGRQQSAPNLRREESAMVQM
jgi:hypothetical protein